MKEIDRFVSKLDFDQLLEKIKDWGKTLGRTSMRPVLSLYYMLSLQLLFHLSSPKQGIAGQISNQQVILNKRVQKQPKVYLTRVYQDSSIHNKEKALITLFYYEERSMEEISEILKLSSGNVKVKLHRTRKKIYLLMNEESRYGNKNR